MDKELLQEVADGLRTEGRRQVRIYLKRKSAKKELGLVLSHIFFGIANGIERGLKEPEEQEDVTDVPLTC